MNWLQYWKEINNENINKYYYGISRNVRNYARFIKIRLGTKKEKEMSEPLKNFLERKVPVQDCTIFIYHPIPNIMIFLNKYNQVLIVFDVKNKKNPIALTTITTIQKELLGEKQFISFIKYLKRNKVHL